MCGTKKAFAVFLLVIFTLPFLCQNVHAKSAFTFDVKDDGSALSVTTSKRLHYGMLSKSDYDGDPNYETLFFKTLMIEPQEGFFDLSKAGTNESATRASTDLEFGGNFYSPANGLSKEYLLYTEFDRLSKPALFNYLTVGNIAIRIIAKNNKLPKKLNEKIDKLLDAAEKVREVAFSALEIARTMHKVLKAIAELSEAPEGSDVKQQAEKLGGAIETIEQILGVLEGAGEPTEFNNLYNELKGSRRFRGGHVGATALYKRFLKLLSGDIANADVHLSKIVDNKTLQKTIIEVLIETFLRPFCHNGNFYFPKSGNYLKERKTITQAELVNYDHIRVMDMAHDFTRYLKEQDIGKATQRRLRLASKAIFFTAGSKLLLSLQDFIGDMKNIEKTLEFTKHIKESVNDLELTAEDIFKFTGTLIEIGLSELKDEMGEISKDIMISISKRLASYAIPGAGWAKAAVDIAGASNLGGAFALDVFTAPRQVPFLLETVDGKTEVYEPFTLNLLKLSYFRYKDGVNEKDPFSNGEYGAESYFLAGNSNGSDEIGGFKRWNTNNRDATLAASGIAYSYDVRIGAFGYNGIKSFHNVFKYKDDFESGLYSLTFNVKWYKNDDFTVSPETFTSPLTGVENQIRDEIRKTYLTDAVGLEWEWWDRTDYKIRHVKKMENIYEWEEGELHKVEEYGETGEFFGEDGTFTEKEAYPELLKSIYAGFELTKSSLDELTEESISANIIAELEHLKYQRYTDENKFRDDLKRTIGDDQTIQLYGQSRSLYSVIIEHTEGITQTDFYYLSFKDNFVDMLERKYPENNMADSYRANKGIMHLTPGIYEIKVGIGINSPDNDKIKVTGQTMFEDKQLMFVMASVSNGNDQAENKSLDDPKYIPHIGIPEGNRVNDRYFSFDRKTDRYTFHFKLKENENFKRNIRIALLDKAGDNPSDFSNFTFYTLETSEKNTDGKYSFIVPSFYFEEQDDGSVFTKRTLRIAWYDHVLKKYCEYTGVSEDELVTQLFKRNKDARKIFPEDAVSKVFMAGAKFGDIEEYDPSKGSLVFIKGSDDFDYPSGNIEIVRDSADSKSGVIKGEGFGVSEGKVELWVFTGSHHQIKWANITNWSDTEIRVSFEDWDHPIYIRIHKKDESSGEDILYECLSYPFTDIRPVADENPDAWYSVYVMKLWEKKIVQGHGGTNLFKPAENSTRAEFIKMAVIASEKAQEADELTSDSETCIIPCEDWYGDISPGDWYCKYVAAAYNKGWLTLDEKHRNFNPNDLINRAEVAKLLVKAIGKEYLVNTAGLSFTNKFADMLEQTDNNKWFYNYAYLCRNLKIFGGYPPGEKCNVTEDAEDAEDSDKAKRNFCPHKPIVRAEVAKVICRAFFPEDCD